jgi:hypothetical protein
MLLVWDKLKGHRTPELMLWLFAHGVMVLFTPLGGSWLNMAKSIQRIVGQRALDGQHPQTPAQIIAWLEATARGWNAHPTLRVGWEARRSARPGARTPPCAGRVRRLHPAVTPPTPSHVRSAP